MDSEECCYSSCSVFWLVCDHMILTRSIIIIDHLIIHYTDLATLIVCHLITVARKSKILP